MSSRGQRGPDEPKRSQTTTASGVSRTSERWSIAFLAAGVPTALGMSCLVGCDASPRQYSTDGVSEAADGGDYGGGEAGLSATSDAGGGDNPSGATSDDSDASAVDTSDRSGGNTGTGDSGQHLATPMVTGERSAGHFDLTWLWDAVPDVSHYEVRLANDEAWLQVDATQYTKQVEDWGTYTLQVRACNAEACSDVATFTTEVESLGAPTGPWRGVERSIGHSPLGRAVGVRCAHCFVHDAGADAERTSVDKVAQAIERGADVVELDVARIGDNLCVTLDPAQDSCSSDSTLEALTTSPAVTDSDAVIWLTLIEETEPPPEFAARLLQELDENRSVVRNGRPLVVQVDHTRLAYVDELHQQAQTFPFVRPYLRFAVSYPRNAWPDVATFQDAIRTDTAGRVVEWVQFGRLTPNLRSLSLFAESLSNGDARPLAIVLGEIPADNGAQHVTALREFADSLSAEYRVDQTKAALTKNNVLAMVDAARCESPADTSVEVLRNTGELSAELVPLGPDTPALMYVAEGEDQFGCCLDLRAETTGNRWLDLGVTTPQPRDGGYLVTASVNFDTLTLEDGVSQDIVANSENAGFYLALVGTTEGTFLRFGVHVGGGYQVHEYDMAQTGLGGALETLTGTDTYHLVGSYAPGDPVRLWIDGQSVGEGAAFQEAVKLSTEPALLGADPGHFDNAEGESVFTPRLFFDGMLQSASVVSWSQEPSGEAN